MGRERLDETLEALELLCEKVSAPKGDLEFIHYFCGNTEIPEELKSREVRRTALYKATVAFIRAYANIADELEAADYSATEITHIRKRMDHYVKLREVIRKASGETIDLKAYEADMRHLLDNYIQADDSVVIHFFNGNRYLLKVIEHDAPAKVELKPQTIELYVRPGTSKEKRQIIVNEWNRKQLKKSIPTIIRKYEKLMNIEIHDFGVKKMKTKWGTCNVDAKRIWLNLELAKKPGEYLEYVVVHEMVHLLEPTHNNRFITLMNQFMPKWKFFRDELNRLPVGHEDWS